MKEVLIHAVLGPDLDDEDFARQIDYSYSGFTFGDGGDWVAFDRQRADRVLAAMREPAPENHPADCDLCRTMREEEPIVVMVPLPLVLELAGMTEQEFSELTPSWRFPAF